MKQKGFSLIELLVVVAIIGILAAVGVVAYNGYTKAAKRNATMPNHNNVTKFIRSELTACLSGRPLYLKDGNGKLDTTKDWCNEIDSLIASKNIDPIKNAFRIHFEGEKLKNPYTGILAFICQGTSAEQYKGCMQEGDTGWYANKPPAQITIRTWFMNSEDNIDYIQTAIPIE